MLSDARRYVRAHWRLLLAIILGVSLACFLLLFQLGSLTGGLSPHEIKQAEFSSSWRHLVSNPLNLPLTAVQWAILTIVPHHGHSITRAASPIFGVLALVAFAYILRRWYGVRSAIYGSVIFGLSSWFLHVSRYASVDVLYMWAMPMMLAVLIAWDRHNERKIALVCAVAAVSVLLYIPGMVWLVLAGLLLQSHLLLDSWHNAERFVWRFTLLLTPLIILLPLVLAFVSHPTLVQTWLGLPQHFGAPGSVLRGLVHSVSFFVYRGPATPELWLLRAPILSFFGMVMAVLGVLFYAKHYRAPRTRLLFACFVIGALLFALGGPVSISILVPLVYLFISAGFGYLLHEWLTVFPRNPLARGIGFTLLGVAVGLACLYNLKSYFVVWPHNSATHVAFHKRS
jgi:hypothetical protein